MACAAQNSKLLHSTTTTGSQDQIAQVRQEPLIFRVARNPAAAKNSVNEILTLEELEAPGCSLSMNVYINLPEADESLGVNVAEYVGSLHCLDKRVMNPKFSITSNIQALGLQDASEIIVSVVPVGEDKHVPVPFKGALISAL